MTRAWLILADILVTILLLLSFILFYLYPPTKEKLSFEHNDSTPVIFDENISFETLSKTEERNVTLTWEEFMRIAGKNTYEAKREEFIVYDKYLNDPLEIRLKALEVKEGDPVYIRIFKKEALLEVWIDTGTFYEHLKDYKICAYSGHLGPKQKEGDRQSPEGFYKVQRKHLNPKSKFHLSFNLGYPNAYDRAHKRTGSFLMVHGNCVSIGCYAMTDAKIEEIYALVESALRKGEKFVPVHIYPFRMTEENMAYYSEHRWIDFWMNLKEGYDYFEAEKRVPKISVKDKVYLIEEQ